MEKGKNKFQMELFKREAEDQGEEFADSLSLKIKELAENGLSGMDAANLLVSQFTNFIYRIKEHLKEAAAKPDERIRIEEQIYPEFPTEWLTILANVLERLGYEVKLLQPNGVRTGSVLMTISLRKESEKLEKNKENRD